RRTYNARVTKYNNLTQKFPTVMLATLLGFSSKELLQAPEEKKDNVDLGAILRGQYMFQSYDEVTEHLAANIKAMNWWRWKTIFKYVLFVLVLRLCVIVPIMITTNMAEVAQAVGRFSIFFLFLFDSVFLINSKRKCQWKYKELIVKRMVKELIETCELPEKYPGSSLRWTYDSEKAISGRRTAKSGLFIIEKGDRVLGRDKISGKIGLTRFSLSVTKLFREKSRHKRRLRSRRRRRRKKYKQKFRGILFLADFNKYFKGHTLLRDK